MLEVEPSGHRDRMAARSGQHILEAEKLRCRYLETKQGRAVVTIFPSIFFSSPNLSGRRLDVYHTSTHGVALVRI